MTYIIHLETENEGDFNNMKNIIKAYEYGGVGVMNDTYTVNGNPHFDTVDPDPEGEGGFAWNSNAPAMADVERLQSIHNTMANNYNVHLGICKPWERWGENNHVESK